MKLASAIVLSILVGGGAAAQPVMKIGTGTINDVQHEFAKRFAARIAERAPDKLKVEVYPGEQLGSYSRMVEGLTLGSVEGITGPPEFLVGIDPRFQIMGAPGVVRDMAHAGRLITDERFRAALFSFGEAKGVKGIAGMVYGPNSYATRRPVKALNDFKGMKIRVFASPMHNVAMERLGATGVPMIPSEAMQALASGVIDGMRSGMLLFVAFKYHDFVKTVTQIDGDAMIFSQATVSKLWFDKLPPDTQKLVLDTAASLQRELVDWSMEQNKKAEKTWQERGGQFIRITGPEQAEFERRMATVGEEVVQKNPRLKEAYGLMVERAKATR